MAVVVRGWARTWVVVPAVDILQVPMVVEEEAVVASELAASVVQAFVAAAVDTCRC